MEKYKKAIYHIRIQLGFPLISVVLTDEQITESILIAKKEFEFNTLNLTKKQYKKALKIKKIWVRKYALALCKEMLGRVREKFSHVTIAGERFKPNFKYLLHESEVEKHILLEKYLPYNL